MKTPLPKDVKFRLILSRAALFLCALISSGMLASAALGALSQGEWERIQILPKARVFVRPDINQKGINLNTATKEELMSLPGIGDFLAEQLILKRGEKPFCFIEDLRVVKGIGDKRIAVLRPLAYVPLPETSEEARVKEPGRLR